MNDDSEQAIADDIAAVARISAVPSMLRICCQATGMGFAAVARVSDGNWTACAVQDDIQFGLKVGGRLEVQTTLCSESRTARRPVVIDHASQDPVYASHHTPRTYNIESYISVPIVLPNGEYFGNLCAIDPKPAKVSDVRTVAVFERFAELIALQLESEQRREDAESALTTERATAELREHFIAVLGHDLRSPLSAIAMTGELLARRPEADLEKMGQRLGKSAKRMALLIEDVMDFARARLGNGIGAKLVDSDDLGRQLADVVAELRAAYPDREVVSRIAIDATVRCDAGRLQQLLSNLLGNALTYGAVDQPVEVDARIRDEVLEISVANQGEPIPSESQGRVFEPYWRPVSSAPGGGLGLGLYICAEIIKAHDGGLKVTSSLDKGTRFMAQLPLR